MKKIDATDPQSHSADLVGRNLDQLRALFPDVFTEGAVNFAVLKQLLGAAIDDREEKYGLSWHGKRRARQLALTPSTGTLRPCPEDSVAWDTTQNLMIEGDNLEVLKLLQKSYAGRVKLIYIDPPYNTGQDFVYPDDYKDNIKNYLELTGQLEGGRKVSSNTESSGRFHTDWLNMIYPRVKLARNLLRSDGLICISIDDFERDNLKRVCDEIFGEENFVESIIWKKRYGGGAKEKHLISVHEYVLVYAKDINELGDLYVPQTQAAIERYYTKRDSNYDKRGPYRTHPLEATKSMGDRPNLVFPIEGPGGKKIMPKRQWLWSKDRVALALKNNEIEFAKDRDGNWTAHSKQYLKELSGEVRQGKAFSIIDDVYSQHGTNELLELFGDAHVYPFPKPTGLLKPILEFGAPDPDSIVVDFFAGSGTTAQAVMNLNVADKGRRRYLLVQLPEPIDKEANKSAAEFCKKLGKPQNIAEITKERLRRAAKSLAKQHGGFAGDLGFRVFKLDTTNIREWAAQRQDVDAALQTSIEHLKVERTEQDILCELLLKLGLDLCVPIDKKTIVGKDVHSIGGGVLMACLTEKIGAKGVDELALGIVKWHKALAPAGDVTCVFRDAAFENDVAKTNMVAILEQHGLKNVRSL